MKKLLLLIGTIVLVFGAVGIAGAYPYIYQDHYDPGGLLMSGLGYQDDPTGTKSVSWQFDITRDGFDPGFQDVLYADVTLTFEDNEAPGVFNEYARLTLGDNYFQWEANAGNIVYQVESLFTLSTTGMLHAVLTATDGDFFFNYASLFAEATQPPNGVGNPPPVPEPATIMLLAAGAMGVAGFRKKFAKR